MMDRGDNHSAVICKLCGEAFSLPEDEVEGNLPRVLLCGHIFCTSCLTSIQCDGVIRCPECEVELALPEGRVNGLQEDSRIIGLIYTAKMNRMKRSKNHRWNKLLTSTDTNANIEDIDQRADIEKIEKSVDEALAQAAENLAQLEHIHETLTAGLTEQVRREQMRLEMEIKQAADKALRAIQKWKDVQLCELTKLEAQVSTSQSEACCVQERIKTLKIAMQMAREIRRVPFLEQYCTLDKVLETLQTPVDRLSFHLKSLTVGSGMSCVFHSQESEGLNQSLSLYLKMEVNKPKHKSKSPSKCHQVGSTTRKPPWPHAEGRNSTHFSPRRNKLPAPLKEEKESPGTNRLSVRGSRCHLRCNFSQHNSDSGLGAPEVIIKEFLDDGQKQAVPPTGPQLANDKWRFHRRRKNLFDNTRNVAQWVVVTHIVSPNHFYIRYVAEERENEDLSKRINHFSCRNTESHFISSDTVEAGSMIFVKWEGLWFRARVLDVSQKGCVDAVKACLVDQLASIQVFFLDCGLTKSLTIQSEEETTKSSLTAVNNHLRKVCEAANLELGHFAPQAIRCSLKDLVPYDLTKGWSEEAQVEFRNVVGSAAVEMRPLGQDRDSLLVDLRKAPMDQSSDVPISVKEYLVFIEVARFYSPVTLDKKPLQYYPPVCPKLNTELNAVVSHINSPADFYIQLVDNMESLLLSAKLQDRYNATILTGEDDLSVYCPVIGQAYIARYDDKLWYRAHVIECPGGRKVEVLYVDFGNKKILSVSDLRKIKDEFFALPCIAVHCCLSDVIPLDGESWSEACTNRFISLAHQKLVTIVATESAAKNEPLPVKLFKSGLDGPLADIAELLVKEELACFREGLNPKNLTPLGDDSAIWDPPLELGLAPEGVDDPDQIISAEPNEQLLDLQPLLKPSAQLKDLKVRVSHVNSPSSFYVQLTQYDSQLKRMFELLKQECVHVEAPDVVWKTGMYCAAHINSVWERGQIISDVTSSNTAEVMRCDYGSKVKLHICSLRPLPSSLMGSLALECTLTDIRPAGGRSTWTATACDIISYYLDGASAVMTIKELIDERPVPVTLLCFNKMGQFVSMADFLASEGLALKDRKPGDAVVQKPQKSDTQSSESKAETSGDNINAHSAASLIPLPPMSSSIWTAIPPKPNRRTIMSAEKVQTQLYQPPELPGLGLLQMNVSAVGEDGIIYTRTQNAECQLEQLRDRIQQSLKTLPRQKPYTWKSVLGCAVIGPDMLWYRGQLLEVLGGHVMVQYVDYGLVENIPVVHVYPMLLCDNVPQLCVPCQLHSINPVGGRWQTDAVALLKEMLLNRCVDVQVMELPTDPRGPLTVELFLDGLSLNRILCHHQHASVDQAVSAQEEPSAVTPASLDVWDINTEGLRGPEELILGPFVYPKLPQEGEKFQVMVKHLLTPNKLFLWPLEGAADVKVDGETFDEALTRINANFNSLPKLTNFPQGGPCLAEYSDGKYYRAKLIKFTSLDPVTILVQHVDFGSDDTLPTSKLRQMPAELLAFPTRALKVKVAGFKAPSVSLQEDVLPYSPTWSVKAAMDMIDLLHSNISASVVAQEPELTVLLYDQDGQLVHLPLVSRGLAELE